MSSYRNYSLGYRRNRYPLWSGASKYRRSRAWYGRTTYDRSAKTMAAKALAGLRKMSWRVQGERRFADQEISTTSSVTPAGYVINDLASGDAPAERTGLAIKMLYVDLRGILIASATNPSSLTRIVMVMDTQQLPDTAPAYTDVFSDASMVSHLRSTTLGRYTILYDKIHGTSAQAQTPCDWNERIWLNQVARFNGTSISDIQKNGLYIYIVGTDTSAGPYVEIRARLCYLDN